MNKALRYSGIRNYDLWKCCLNIIYVSEAEEMAHSLARHSVIQCNVNQYPQVLITTNSIWSVMESLINSSKDNALEE